MEDDIKRFRLCAPLRLTVKPDATYTVERPSQGHHEENGSALGDRKYHLCIKQQKSM